MHLAPRPYSGVRNLILDELLLPDLFVGTRFVLLSGLNKLTGSDACVGRRRTRPVQHVLFDVVDGLPKGFRNHQGDCRAQCHNPCEQSKYPVDAYAVRDGSERKARKYRSGLSRHRQCVLAENGKCCVLPCLMLQQCHVPILALWLAALRQATGTS